jgi:hypothetical protein
LSNVTVKERAYNLPLSINMYREANEKGVTFSQYLESVDPTEEYGADEKLDAFERQLKRFGIITQAIPEKGIYADKVEKFYVASTRRLTRTPTAPSTSTTTRRRLASAASRRVPTCPSLR